MKQSAVEPEYMGPVEQDLCPDEAPGIAANDGIDLLAGWMNGAGDETRTRNFQLGKLTLYH